MQVENILQSKGRAVATVTAGTTIAEAVEPYISTRIKMGDTGNIRVVVQAGGKNYTATKEVKVTIGGCG